MTWDEVNNANKYIAEANDRFFLAFGKAIKAVKHSELLSGVVWAQIAADTAFHRHPGFYFSSELESLLIEVAELLPVADQHPLNFFGLDGKGITKPRILHVMTNAYGTGGHSRLVERLVANTSAEYEHFLVTTAQRGKLPDRLHGLFCHKGCKWVDLAASGADLLGRGIRLRRISRETADIVFLHSHPYDVVPTLAFGIPGGPPVIVLNHADHLFWVGVSVADVVADLRLAGQLLTLTRRHAKASKILPIPLVEREALSDRAIARRRLGIDDDAVVLLTMASPYKYLPIAGYNFLATVIDLLKRHSNVVLIACGPENSGVWKEASMLVGGRIKAYGVQADISNFHAAANIYLDSFPYASLTSSLEAALHAMPIIGLSNASAPIFSDGSIVEGDGWTHANSQTDYFRRLNALIADPELRDKDGSRIKEQIAAHHLLPNWRGYFDDLIGGLPTSHSVCIEGPQPQQTNEDDFFLATMAQLMSTRYSINTSLRKHGGCLPAKDRLGLLLRGIFGIDGVRVLPLGMYAGKEYFS